MFWVQNSHLAPEKRSELQDVFGNLPTEFGKVLFATIVFMCGTKPRKPRNRHFNPP